MLSAQGFDSLPLRKTYYIRKQNMNYKTFAEHMLNAILVHRPQKNYSEWADYENEEFHLCAAACAVVDISGWSLSPDTIGLQFSHNPEYFTNKFFSNINVHLITRLNDKTNLTLRDIADEVSKWDDCDDIYARVEELIIERPKN